MFLFNSLVSRITLVFNHDLYAFIYIFHFYDGYSKEIFFWYPIPLSKMEESGSVRNECIR